MANKDIEIPFGAYDSELGGFEYTIPEGYKAEIKDGKVVVKKTESEDERIRNEIIAFIEQSIHRGGGTPIPEEQEAKWLAWLEKQGEQKLYVNDNAKEMFIKALERVEEQNNKGYKLTDCDKNSWWEDFKAYTSCTIEQKPTWSEEDETTKNNISHIIRQYDKISKRENKPCWYIGDCLLWMQNIKDRVQPKKEWSEQDNKNLKECVIAISMSEGHTLEEKEQLENWLKSLKERYTWKPSKEQIIALRWVLNNVPYNKHKEEISGLLDQIKGL